MKGLLAIEWLKIRRYRTFWVLVGLFIVLMPLWNYEVAYGIINLGGGKNGINFLSTAYSFPMVWSNLGYWGSIFITFISILVIIITTNEYTYRTHRQNVIDGWSRVQFFNAKVLLISLLAALSTVYIFLLGIVFGGINSGSLSELFTDIYQLAYFFIMTLDYLGFALIIAIWIKRSGLAIGLFLLYSMIIENIVKGLVNHYTDTTYGNLMPLQAGDELLPFPLMRMAKSMLALPEATVSMNTYAIVAIMWCAVYYFAGRYILLKRDW